MAKRILLVTVRVPRLGNEVKTSVEFDTDDYSLGDGSLDIDKLEEEAREAAFQMIDWSFVVDGES